MATRTYRQFNWRQEPVAISNGDSKPAIKPPKNQSIIHFNSRKKKQERVGEGEKKGSEALPVRCGGERLTEHPIRAIILQVHFSETLYIMSKPCRLANKNSDIELSRLDKCSQIM